MQEAPNSSVYMPKMWAKMSCPSSRQRFEVSMGMPK